ncbi:MAG: DUF3467 domain-containing protein [Phycisphaerae bacterium]|nr:DUF3467 domain-containing protein [Phycisphaerae bacterium]MDW8261123.1 DUF3467 domain-containing protein [Phycisphaerales bacterium]
MSEQDTPQGGEGQSQAQQQPGIQVLVDERETRTTYSNAYRFNQTAEEVIMDLGFNMPNPNPGQLPPNTQAQLLFKVTDRIVMSYPSAKRLLMSLTQLLKRYEQQFGEIPMQPGRR